MKFQVGAPEQVVKTKRALCIIEFDSMPYGHIKVRARTAPMTVEPRAEFWTVQFCRSDFADLIYFLEISKHRNFWHAGLTLGVSVSVLSHALRGLEERVGVCLQNRTSRGVNLTAVDEERRAAISESFDVVGRTVL